MRLWRRNGYGYGRGYGYGARATRYRGGMRYGAAIDYGAPRAAPLLLIRLSI